MPGYHVSRRVYAVGDAIVPSRVDARGQGEREADIKLDAGREVGQRRADGVYAFEDKFNALAYRDHDKPGAPIYRVRIEGAYHRGPMCVPDLVRNSTNRTLTAFLAGLYWEGPGEFEVIETLATRLVVEGVLDPAEIAEIDPVVYATEVGMRYPNDLGRAADLIRLAGHDPRECGLR